ncbi:amino acid transporter AVT1J-like [Patiria miniata]|uniref:Amino acid transporter transmembrane domain-containing protein n=1 Tax=Patiria miniata TaxID=46514 RepID=A0A913ZHD0_PATMI|nr:amino acid transporter AVT1J-like [Patiria miniata]
MADGQTLRLIEKPRSESGGQDLSEDDKETEEGEPVQADGINFWQTAISLSGSFAGLGFLAVEVLVVSTGWDGFCLFLSLYLALFYTSVILGRCWNMVREKWGNERHPYGAIGYEAYGDWARKLINFLVAATCFTNAIGSLLGFTELTLTIGGPALQGTLCYWPLAYGLLICPFLWLGTPKNFWWILANSFFTVVLSVILIIMSIFLAGDSHSSGYASDSNSSGYAGASDETQQESQYLHLAEIAGTVIWLVGLHGSFPTVQQDMKQPQAFTQSIILADLMTLFLCLPVMLALFIVYGDTLTNVTGNAIVFTLLPDDALKKVSAFLILIHLAGVVLVVNNPLFQYLEEVLNISPDFSWKRVVLRSSILLGQVFIQETLPHFTLVSSISGGFLTPLLALLIPCLCYIRLRSQRQEKPSNWFVLETVVCLFIIAATPCLMVAILLGTGTAIARGDTAFTVPCYVNATRAAL